MLIELREGARCACGAQASIAHFKVCRMFYAPTKTHNAVEAEVARACRSVAAYQSQPLMLGLTAWCTARRSARAKRQLLLTLRWCNRVLVLLVSQLL